MNAEAFSSPFFVKRASYIVQEIASPADAIEFLNEWPEDRRDLTYETALRACCDAYAGHIPVGAASNAFVGFAKRVAILGPILRYAVARCVQGGQRKSAGIGFPQTVRHWRKATVSRLS
ncbi:DUF982 domain-containing protein [Mesorhizobium sp.]|uniref:DUF982 domain-containing protein n=1 Tax=Mesorhizobium sp. TaxID=1871066 RepID=UPI00338DA2A3